MTLVALVVLCGCNRIFFSDEMDAVRDKLVDPDSAQFSEMKTCGGGAVRGWVNSKNYVGGYTGKKEFVVVNGVASIDGPTTELDFLNALHICLSKLRL